MRDITTKEIYTTITKHFAAHRQDKELMQRYKSPAEYAKYLHDTNEYSGCYPAYTTADCYEIDLVATKKGVELSMGLSLLDDDRAKVNLTWQAVADMCFDYQKNDKATVRHLTPKAWSKVWTAVWNL